MIKVIVCDSTEKMNQIAAWEFIKQALIPHSVIGVSTGNTTTPIHKKIVEVFNACPFDVSSLYTCSIDDYCGLPEGHVASCATRIHGQLIDPLGLGDRGLLPDTSAIDIDKAAVSYEMKIDSLGGIDLLILGFGTDGHLGFCRPGTELSSNTHKVKIPEDTLKMLIKSYQLSEKQLPQFGITLGLKNFMSAKKIIVVANGINKSDAVSRAIKQEITTECPGSVLQLHPCVTWILDENAASLL